MRISSSKTISLRAASCVSSAAAAGNSAIWSRIMNPDHRKRRVKTSRSWRGPVGVGDDAAGIVEEDIVSLWACALDRKRDVGLLAIVDHFLVSVACARHRGLF